MAKKAGIKAVHILYNQEGKRGDELIKEALAVYIKAKESGYGSSR